MRTDPEKAPEAFVAQAAPPVPVVVAPPPRRRGVLDYALAAALVLAVGGVAFAVGRGSAPAAPTQFPVGALGPDASFDPTGSFDPGGFAPPGGLTFGGQTFDGTVTAIDADSITIELPDGSEVELATDAQTTYHAATVIEPSGVAVGDPVRVRGSGGRLVAPGNGPAPSAAPGGGTITATDITVDR